MRAVVVLDILIPFQFYAGIRQQVQLACGRILSYRSLAVDRDMQPRNFERTRVAQLKTEIQREVSKRKSRSLRSEVRSRFLLLFLFLNFDAKGLEKLQILVVDFEFGVGGQRSNEGSFVGSFFALLADADGRFEDKKNVVAAFFDPGDDFGDLFGIRERLVDRF